MDLNTFIKEKKSLKKSDIVGLKKLFKKARQEGLFRVKLTDFVEQLARTFSLTKEDFKVNAELKVIFPGLNANNSSVLRMFDLSPNAREQKIMKVTVKSTTTNWNFEESYDIRFNICANSLANGQKFREALNFEKDRERKQTIITLKPNSEENLMVDFTHAYLNGQLKAKSLSALFTCVKNKEASKIETSENTKK